MIFYSSVLQAGGVLSLPGWVVGTQKHVVNAITTQEFHVSSCNLQGRSPHQNLK